MKNSITHSFKNVTHKMVSKVKIGVSLGAIALCASMSAQAANQTTIPLDLAGANATKHEIAVLQVLSEVCPSMLTPAQSVNFRRTYNAELKKMLPASINNPAAAINYLSTQQDYKMVLSSMRDWTMGFSHEENLALCTDLANAKIQ